MKKGSGTIKTAQRQPMCCCQALATACQGEEKPNCEETAKQMYWPAKSSEMIEKRPKSLIANREPNKSKLEVVVI